MPCPSSFQRHDAHAVAVSDQPAAEQGHAEGRMIHVGVARDKKNIKGIPPDGVHFGAGGGQERRLRQRRARGECKIEHAR